MRGALGCLIVLVSALLGFVIGGEIGLVRDPDPDPFVYPNYWSWEVAGAAAGLVLGLTATAVMLGWRRRDADE